MPNIKRGMMGAAGVVSESVAGELWAWGFNNYGGLGTGNTTAQSSPVQVGSDATWTYVAVGTEDKFSLGISAGKLFGWGKQASGQLGLGNTTIYSSPVQVGSRTDWEKCFAAHGHAAAITSDGDLFMWGRNNHGQLGNGNTTNLSSPVQVAGTWTTFGGHYGVSNGIKDGGTLWSWGRGNSGGHGNTTSYSSPVQIGSLTTWSKVLGGYASHAIKTDGTLWGWGPYPEAIGTGLSGYDAVLSPVQIGSLTTWRDLQKAAKAKALALTTADTMFVWGFGDDGRLGLGNTTNYSSPVQLGSLTTFSKVGRTDGHTNSTHIITTGGTLWGWGYNGGGQVGDGSTTARSSPVQIGSLTTWIMIANGQPHTLGIKSA